MKGVLLCFVILSFTAYAFASSVPDDGQPPFIYPMSYTKLDVKGNALPSSAMSWAMVKDNITDLIWEVKTNLYGKTNSANIHDAGNTYTWYNSNPATNGGNAGTAGTDTSVFITQLNNAIFGGYSDWRLPTIKELTYIVDYSVPYPGPTINPIFYNINGAVNVPTVFYYWSSTTYPLYSGSACGINFNQGNNYGNSKSNTCYVRAVRGGQTEASPSYINNGDATVTDISTGLMWQQGRAPNTMTLADAEAYCTYLNQNYLLGGHNNWRLPTIKELCSLSNYNSRNPSIDSSFFPDTASSFYWSSTINEFYTHDSWLVSFSDGNFNFFDSSDYSYYVRVVRDAQLSPLSLSISANGKNGPGPVTVSSKALLSIAISLVPGIQTGQTANLWLACYSYPTQSWISYTVKGVWVNGIQPYWTASSPLADINSEILLNSGTQSIQVGSYTLYFGVNFNPNGILDASSLTYDWINVNVTK